jgi:hypothetical protein
MDEIFAPSAKPNPTRPRAGSPPSAELADCASRSQNENRVAGVLRERVADRRGRNVGAVAAARRQLEFVFYALRDGHVRALEHLPRVA